MAAFSDRLSARRMRQILPLLLPSTILLFKNGHPASLLAPKIQDGNSKYARLHKPRRLQREEVTASQCVISLGSIHTRSIGSVTAKRLNSWHTIIQHGDYWFVSLRHLQSASGWNIFYTKHKHGVRITILQLLKRSLIEDNKHSQRAPKAEVSNPKYQKSQLWAKNN